MPKDLPFGLNDYLVLVDWTGRVLRYDEKGAIPNNLPPMLTRLNMESIDWHYLTQNFESRFKRHGRASV